jgi:hypothetical protein
LHKAEQGLHGLNELGQGMITEKITVTHGAPLHQWAGYINTGDAYYRADMQDMRLLRSAETDLQKGDTKAARRELSGVRFPYVTANVQFSPDRSEAIADRVTLDLQRDHPGDAKFDAEQLTVNAHAYASLYANTVK